MSLAFFEELQEKLRKRGGEGYSSDQQDRSLSASSDNDPPLPLSDSSEHSTGQRRQRSGSGLSSAESISEMPLLVQPAEMDSLKGKHSNSNGQSDMASIGGAENASRLFTLPPIPIPDTKPGVGRGQMLLKNLAVRSSSQNSSPAPSDVDMSMETNCSKDSSSPIKQQPIPALIGRGTRISNLIAEVGNKSQNKSSFAQQLTSSGPAAHSSPNLDSSNQFISLGRGAMLKRNMEICNQEEAAVVDSLTSSPKQTSQMKVAEASVHSGSSSSSPSSSGLSPKVAGRGTALRNITSNPPSATSILQNKPVTLGRGIRPIEELSTATNSPQNQGDSPNSHVKAAAATDLSLPSLDGGGDYHKQRVSGQFSNNEEEESLSPSKRGGLPKRDFSSSMSSSYRSSDDERRVQSSESESQPAK